jgi:hypothetical protein
MVWVANILLNDLEHNDSTYNKRGFYVTIQKLKN